MEEDRKKGTFLKVLAIILAVAAVAALVFFAVKFIRKFIAKAKASGQWAGKNKIYFDVPSMDAPEKPAPRTYNDFGTTAANLEKRIGGNE